MFVHWLKSGFIRLCKFVAVGCCEALDTATTLLTAACAALKACAALLQGTSPAPAPSNAPAEEPVAIESMSTSKSDPSASCEPDPEPDCDENSRLTMFLKFFKTAFVECWKKFFAWVGRTRSSRVKPAWGVRRNPRSERWTPKTIRGASYA
jgi:hypothetical protein